MQDSLLRTVVKIYNCHEDEERQGTATQLHQPVCSEFAIRLELSGFRLLLLLPLLLLLLFQLRRYDLQ
jgi:hypothetical protein